VRIPRCCSVSDSAGLYVNDSSRHRRNAPLSFLIHTVVRGQARSVSHFFAASTSVVVCSLDSSPWLHLGGRANVAPDPAFDWRTRPSSS